MVSDVSTIRVRKLKNEGSTSPTRTTSPRRVSNGI